MELLSFFARSDRLLFLFFALDAKSGVRERVESFHRDRFVACKALSVRLILDATERFVDVIQKTLTLGGEHECLLSLLMVGALIGHVERVA